MEREVNILLQILERWAVNSKFIKLNQQLWKKTHIFTTTGARKMGRIYKYKMTKLN